MPDLRLPSRLLVVAALSFGAALTALVWAPPVALAAGPADDQAKDLVSLINGERAYLHLSALKVDTFLAAKARDGAVACPNDASKVMSGRAKDFAVNGYPSNSHLLRLCTQYSSMDAMKSWGYKSYRGEVTALNGGYGTAQHDYTYGCSPTVRTCPGGSTTGYYTSVRAVTNWVSSSTHYAVIMGNYDRIGCGAWIGSNGAYFYDCMVSRGGRSGTTSSAPKTPSAPKTSSPPKKSTSKVAGVAATPKPTPTATPVPTGTPFVEVLTEVINPRPYETPTAAATDQAAAPGALSHGGGDGSGGVQSDAPAAPPPGRSRDVSLAAGLATAMLSFGYWLLLNVKKRLQRSHGNMPLPV